MMLSRDYRKPFWRGLVHAVGIFLYICFMTLVVATFPKIGLYELPVLVGVGAWVLLLVVSLGVAGYGLFFEPMHMLKRHHFKAGSVMLLSTLGWLLLFFILFIIGLFVTR